jgi:hypothetical protein
MIPSKMYITTTGTMTILSGRRVAERRYLRRVKCMARSRSWLRRSSVIARIGQGESGRVTQVCTRCPKPMSLRNQVSTRQLYRFTTVQLDRVSCVTHPRDRVSRMAARHDLLLPRRRYQHLSRSSGGLSQPSTRYPLRSPRT